MPQDAVNFRHATPADAGVLATLINMAGDGLPHYLWTAMAQPGEEAWEVGRSRARREEGGFSYRNSLIAELGGVAAGCLIGYPLPKETEEKDFSSIPPMFVPMEELEALAPNTWYVNVVAVFPEFRGQGVGSRLLERAEQAAHETGRPGLSLIVADANAGARRLYERSGYDEIAKRPIVKEQWPTDARNWVLMVKPLAA